MLSPIILVLSIVLWGTAALAASPPSNGACAFDPCKPSVQVTPNGVLQSDDQGDLSFVTSQAATTLSAKTFGAMGDGGTDDTAAIRAASAAASTAGVPLFFPAGTYCVKTGPITVSMNGSRWQGVNRETSILSACGADSQILVDNAFHDEYYNLAFWGSNTPGTTKDTVTFNSAGYGGYSEVTMEWCGIYHGRYAINTASGEQYLYNNKLQSHYGPATIYVTGPPSTIAGGYIVRNKMDQPWPAGTPDEGSITLPIPAWQSSHAYTQKSSLVTVSASGVSYTLQAMSSGTSGGTAPTVPPYGVTVNDGNTSWQLAKPTSYNGVQCDTNCGGIIFIDYNDFSSTYDNGIAITNTLAGNNPYGVYISNNVFGSLLQNDVFISAGNTIKLVNNHLGGGVGNPWTGVSAFGFSDLSIIGGEIQAGNGVPGATGIYIAGSGGTIINGVNIGPVQTALSIAANVSSVTMTASKVGGSYTYGNNNEGVFIAVGTSDYIHLTSNDYAGAATPIDDRRSAQGGHDIIQYDVHGENCSGTPTSSFQSSGGLVSHC